MFVVLEVDKCQKSKFSTLKSTFLKSSLQFRKEKIENSAPFYVVSVCNQDKIPWKKLSVNLGRLSNKVLLPNDISITEKCGVKAINITDELHAISLLNTAKLVAKYSSIPANKMRISIVDRQGVYYNHIERILNSASHLRIITNNYKKYEPVVDDIFDYWGASVFLSSDINLAKKSNIVISPHEEILGTNALVLTLDKCKSFTCNTAIAHKLLLPNEYLEYLPKGIDEHKFASVLYDEFKFKSLSNVSLDKMIINGCEKSVYEMAKLMDSQLCYT